MIDTKEETETDILEQYNGKWISLYFVDDGTCLDGEAVFDSIDEFNEFQYKSLQKTNRYNSMGMGHGYTNTKICCIGNKINPANRPTATSVIPIPMKEQE